MIEFLQYVFRYVVHDFAVLACMVFLFYWKRLSKIETWIALLIFACTFIDLLAASFAFKNLHNQWIYNIGFPIQLLFLVYIYSQIMSDNALKKNLTIGYFLFMVLYTLDLLFVQKMEVLNTYVYIPACIGIAIISYVYLKDIISNTDIIPKQHFLFWFACATLINYTASVPLVALLTWPQISAPVWAKIYYLSNIIDCTWFGMIGGALIYTKWRTSYSL